MANPRGIDVSHFQGDVNWLSVAQSGVSFAFAKATEGTSYVDPKFAANWAGMKDAGIQRGAYHFFEPDDGTTQGQHFLATLGSDHGELPPVCDLETGSPAQSDVQAWLDTVQQGTGVTPIIYASRSFANDHLRAFGSYPLWLAEYTSASEPTLPSAWDTWTFWQHSDGGSVPGVSGSVDEDYHNGPLGSAPPAPATTTTTTTAPATSSGQTYTVQAGDTLSAIAARFGTTVDAIAAANDITDPDVIGVGQVLKIP